MHWEMGIISAHKQVLSNSYPANSCALHVSPVSAAQTNTADIRCRLKVPGIQKSNQPRSRWGVVALKQHHFS